MRKHVTMHLSPNANKSRRPMVRGKNCTLFTESSNTHARARCALTGQDDGPSQENRLLERDLMDFWKRGEGAMGGGDVGRTMGSGGTFG
jgi:hypothetical protein